MQLCIKTFDELTAGELYEILRVRSLVFVVEQNCVYQDPDGIDLRSIHVYLEDKGEILAYLRVFLREGHAAEAQIGRVLTVARGKGLGRQVLDAGIRVAAERLQGDRIYLEAQCYAAGFYEKAGFRSISDPFLEDGIPHVQMIMDIK
ncbi:MAG: GNAT family N-acetyltransferase [Ruminococcaceae bacterium]|nr:GNAT family N-acetyltransferase [Oscillospiraceae bacterium]